MTNTEWKGGHKSYNEKGENNFGMYIHEKKRE